MSDPQAVSGWRRTLRPLAHPNLSLLCLAWLMLLVVIGTLAQKDFGLFHAQKKYFESFFFWAGPIPVPGARAVLSLMFVSLLLKLACFTRWKIQFLGLNIVHAGALALLTGGFFTAYYSSEGIVLIDEGQSSNVVHDYTLRELTLAIPESGQKETHITFAEGWLVPGKILKHARLPFELVIHRVHQHCQPVRRKEPNPDPRLKGFSKNFELQAQPPLPEVGQNIFGADFEIRGLGPESDGLYSVFENMSVPQNLQVQGQPWRIELRKRETHLPFDLHLNDVVQQVYPGTNKARSYHSQVDLLADGIRQPALIQMNEPLRHDGYTFFQSQYFQKEKGEATGLAAVYNEGRLFPYISSIVMCIGLLFHLGLQLPRLLAATPAPQPGSVVAARPWVPWASGALVLALAGAWALKPAARTEDPVDLDLLRRLPVQHEGRVKPFDTFARVELLALYGKSRIEGLSAPAWMLELMCDPAEAEKRRSFTIKNPDAATALGLERHKDYHYSFTELRVGLSKHIDLIRHHFEIEQEKRELIGRQLINIYSNASRFAELAQALDAHRPNFELPSPAIAEKLGFDPLVPVSLFQLQSKYEALSQLLTEEGESAEHEELLEEAYYVVKAMQDFESGHTAPSPAFTPDHHHEGPWLSPWGLIVHRHDDMGRDEKLQAWQKLFEAYPKEDTPAAKAALAAALEKLSAACLSDTREHLKQTNLEVLYNDLGLFHKAVALYVLGFLLLGFSWLRPAGPWRRLALHVTFASCMIHGAGIVLRIVIQGRAPVSTLYETTLFVGIVLVGCALVLERLQKNGVGTFIASLAGAVLLYISFGYADDGDSMVTLVAVLNSNFWLATHVTTIIIGYGTTLLAGLFGHIFIFQHCLRRKSLSDLKTMGRNMNGLSLFALFFTLFGTILGGIWADQSWGRFWGWDPKENGAMLIVLSLLVLIHGRIGGSFSAFTTACGLVLTNIVVALAWFGVNLLNVGLHSYGFTEGVALNLAIFCLIEVLVVFVAIVRRPKPSPA